MGSRSKPLQHPLLNHLLIFLIQKRADDEEDTQANEGDDAVNGRKIFHVEEKDFHHRNTEAKKPDVAIGFHPPPNAEHEVEYGIERPYNGEGGIFCLHDVGKNRAGQCLQFVEKMDLQIKQPQN